MTLRQKVVELAPPWLRRTWGARLLHGFGLLFDGAYEWGVQGVRARMPEVATGTALGAIGRDRLIVRGYNESAAGYAQRLKRWLDDWKIAGNPIAVLQQLQGYFAPLAPRLRTVSDRGTWFTLHPDGSVEIHKAARNWAWDGVDRWWRFWVMLYPNSTTPPLFADEGDWGDDGDWGDPVETWGTAVHAQVVETTRRIVATWKPENTHCDYIIVAFDGSTFDPDAMPGAPMPDGTWGRYSDDGTPRLEARETTARYWKGTY